MKTILLKGTDSKMPVVGLGTWQAKPEEIESALSSALDSGYRLIDTAFNYNNEDTIGKILKKHFDENKIQRKDLFITTKLPHMANRACDVEKFLRLSLDKLQLSYVDLYLIHVPFGFKCDETTMNPKLDSNKNIILDPSTDHISLWQAMESVMKKGLTKNIGLSNFNADQIQAIYKAAELKPQVLQVECHLYLQQTSLKKFCDDNNIALMAYSPLGSPGSQNHFQTKYNYELKNIPNIISLPIVQDMAVKHKKSAGQILLKFLILQNIIVIPKSTNPKRIKENVELFDFELEESDIDKLKQLDKGEEGRIIDFLFWKGVDKHPKYPFSKKSE